MVESRLEGPGTNDDDEGNGNIITRSLLTPEEAKDQRLAQVPVQRVRVSATGIEGDEEGETLGYYETMEEADEEIAARASTLCSTYGCLNERDDDYEIHKC